MKEIRLTTGQTAFVDDADFERVNARKWYLTVGRYGRSDKWHVGYELMHRFVLGVDRGEMVDHIDGNGLNNQRSNLRICTHAENMRNRKRNKNNTVGLNGVRHKKGKWSARIVANGKTFYLGTFDAPEIAHAAYVVAAARLHGAFARFN